MRKHFLPSIYWQTTNCFRSFIKDFVSLYPSDTGALTLIQLCFRPLGLSGIFLNWGCLIFFISLISTGIYSSSCFAKILVAKKKFLFPYPRRTRGFLVNHKQGSVFDTSLYTRSETKSINKTPPKWGLFRTVVQTVMKNITIHKNIPSLTLYTTYCLLDESFSFLL